MMPQSIKISDRAKDRISKLQSKLLLDFNIKLSQMDLFEYLIEYALNDEAIIEKIKLKKNPIKKTQKELQWDKQLDNPPDWGMDDLTTNMDDAIAKGFD